MISDDILSNGVIGGTAPQAAPPELPGPNAFPLPLPTPEVPSTPTNPVNIQVPGSRFFDPSSDGRRPIEENDVVIAVMGPTGAGKSSFVNAAAGREEVVIGNNLRSQTRTVQPVRCSHPDGHRNIVLVDTPGFDDTHLSDVQVLKIIASWLKETYQNKIKLSGLLYFHRISDVRFSGTPLRNLSVFKDLCGETNLKNVVLVTTMWDELDDESVGSKREEDLLMNFWKNMIRLGSQTRRFQKRTRESAWDIMECLDLDRLYRKPSLAPLQIQEEMVDRGLQVHATTAARTLLGFLVGEVKRFWGRIRTGTRRFTGTKKPSQAGGLRRQAFLSRSPTSTSTFSEVSFCSSPTDTSSLFSDPSPAESTSTGCSVHGRPDTLPATITGLRLAHQVADIVAIPVLRGAIGTALHAAQLIEGMGGTHHAIRQVIEQSGWLLKEIAQFATHHKLHRDMTKTLKAFSKELENVQKVVVKISSRGSIARFFLHDADVQAISACTASIKAVYSKTEVKFAMDNRQAVARLEEQLMELRKDAKLRQCQCGISIIHKESEENEEYSATSLAFNASASSLRVRD